MSASRVEGFAQCTVCHMYAKLVQQLQDGYRCDRCEQVALLEARIRDLEEQVATLGRNDNLERGPLLAEQVVSKVDVEGGGESQDYQIGRWVNAVRGSGRGVKKGKASPVFVHQNKFAKLGDDVEVANTEVAALDVTATPNSRESNPSSRGGEGSAGRPRQLVVIGDSIIRRTDRIICRQDRFNRMVCCLPGARVRHVVDRVDKLLGGAGHDPAVLVHVGTNDSIHGRWRLLKNQFKELGCKMKGRTSKVIFSEILPVPCATQERQGEIRELNAWLKTWCRKEGFGFLEHWADFSLGCNLYAKDGLHLNGRGSAVLGERFMGMLEEYLN